MDNLIFDIINCDRIKSMAKLKQEAFVVLYLCENTLKGNINFDCLGTKDYVPFPDISTVLSSCKKLNTDKIILVHNHPYYRSWNTLFYKYCNSEPSIIDIASTRIFNDSMKNQNITVLDHIIVCPDKSYFSFAQNGIM